jgi:hypothetical protein
MRVNEFSRSPRGQTLQNLKDSGGRSPRAPPKFFFGNKKVNPAVHSLNERERSPDDRTTPCRLLAITTV